METTERKSTRLIMEKDFAIKIKKLSIGYGHGQQKKQVAENLNAEIRAGELVCLLGANGTGKSTLMRTLTGFIPFFSGDVYIQQTPIKSLNEKSLSYLVSVVLTDRVSVANATVKELVSYGRSPHTSILGRLRKKDHSIINKAIEQCGIAHKRDELIDNLSDGERQKVFIAKALAQDTPIILLDEPTAFLDLPARVEIIQLLRQIASNSGKSILLSTHDLDLALQMADRIWLMRPGGPLITGSPEDLLLQNAFQPMFHRKGIEFDNKTGLFRVKHTEHTIFNVKGHGFGYVLLRRAFARNGIKLSHHANSEKWCVSIDSQNLSFSLYFLDELLFTNTSVEVFVAEALRLRSSMNTTQNPVDEALCRS